MSKSALIFDDEEDILFLCSHILKSLGWQVHTRTLCKNLLPDIEATQPSLVFMDNSINDIGGISATQIIKSHDRYKKIPVIYFSANPQIKSLSIEAGADAYLEKPFDVNTFKDLINSFS